MECCDLLKALTVVVIVYSLKFQKSLEALKWDQGLVYKSYVKKKKNAVWFCFNVSSR